MNLKTLSNYTYFNTNVTMVSWLREEENPRGGGGGVLPSVLNRGYTISHFRPRFPANLLLFSPFDHTIFADFVRLLL